MYVARRLGLVALVVTRVPPSGLAARHRSILSDMLMEADHGNRLLIRRGSWKAASAAASTARSASLLVSGVSPNGSAL